MREFEDSSEKLNASSVCGPDGMHNKMIKKFGPICKQTFLALENVIHLTKKQPMLWHTSHHKLIFKRHKAHLPDTRSDINKYRPIDVTCAMMKHNERMALPRLTEQLTRKNYIKHYSFAYLEAHVAEDSLFRIIDFIKGEWAKGRVIGCLSIDQKKTFDKVWRPIVIVKLH